jgi:hypothetical protein
MPHQNIKPVTGSKTQPQKKVASDDSLFEGEILIGIAENRWRLGRSMGV